MVRGQQQELTELARERITRVVRSLADDQVERGVDLSRPMHCDSCDLEKVSAGSAMYGAYKLCNDCLLDFTLSLAAGGVDSAADFMTKRTDGLAPASHLGVTQERQSLSMNPMSGRDKLMPRNEPC